MPYGQKGRLEMQGKHIGTIVVVVLVFGGLVVLNRTFPASMPDNFRFEFNCLAVLAGLAVIAIMWLPPRRRRTP